MATWQQKTGYYGNMATKNRILCASFPWISIKLCLSFESIISSEPSKRRLFTCNQLTQGVSFFLPPGCVWPAVASHETAPNSSNCSQAARPGSHFYCSSTVCVCQRHFFPDTCGGKQNILGLLSLHAAHVCELQTLGRA